MRILHHLWLSPQCRKVRIVLLEKNIEFELRVEKVWERRESFLALNPAGEVPVLIEPDGVALSDGTAICEFLDETQPDPPLFAHHPRENAEVRREVRRAAVRVGVVVVVVVRVAGRAPVAVAVRGPVAIAVR